MLLAEMSPHCALQKFFTTKAYPDREIRQCLSLPEWAFFSIRTAPKLGVQA